MAHRFPGKVSDLAVYSGLERTDTEQAEAGEIVAVAGLDEVSIGDTIADAEHPVALTRVTIDEPTVQMTFSVNNSPFAGREGKYLTSRHLRDRLFKELETNVSLRVQETDSADKFLVAGRGELHLGVLIEQMRREGYELQVSQPEVIVHREGDKVLEPYEELTIQVPETYQGAVIEELGKRRGELRHMRLIHSDAGPSEMHLEYHIPTRGIMGLKNLLVAKTRGTIIMHHVFVAYEPAEERDLVVATTWVTRRIRRRNQHRLCHLHDPRTGHHVYRPCRGGLSRDGRRREQPGRRSGRQRLQRKAPLQHAGVRHR